MLNYPISPEYCLIVNAFSQRDSLRGAAQLLGTDPAALVRKVQKLVNEHDFLQKAGNRWVVTESGKRVAQWTSEFIASQAQLNAEPARLRIAAFTWLAEEMLIPQLPHLQELLSSEINWSIQMTASDLEQELIRSRADFVIHGTAPNDPAVAHKRISNYPWVVVAPYSWKNAASDLAPKQLVEFLNSRPYVRHSQINPDRILNFVPSHFANILVDGVIGLRAAAVNNMGWTALPAMSVQSHLASKQLLKLKVPTFYADDVSVWWLRANKQSATRARHIGKWLSAFSVI